MRNYILGVVAGTILGGGGAILGMTVLADPPPPAVQVDMFDQANFPCQEDEVLGYNERFGPNKVGCLSIEG